MEFLIIYKKFNYLRNKIFVRIIFRGNINKHPKQCQGINWVIEAVGLPGTRASLINAYQRDRFLAQLLSFRHTKLVFQNHDLNIVF